MELKPFHYWLLTFSLTIAGIVTLPTAARILLIIVAVGHGALLVRGIVDLKSQFFCTARCAGPPMSQQVCLTFDDGPDPAITPDILHILQRYGYVATFFVVARKAAQHPDICRRALAKGHTIACHDLTHSYLSNVRFTGRAYTEIKQALTIITEVIGRRPMLYRPPVGLMNPHIARALSRLGLHCVGWNRSTRDGGNRMLPKIRRIATLAAPGAIIMLHDVAPVAAYRAEVLAQIEALCAAIKQMGLHPVGVGDMFKVASYA
jgi:peptidoglycan/xylan/chitin deacetylase (PgdA/CDA1 family)